MITLKLYGMYYGQMGKTAVKAPEKSKVTFSMKKADGHFTVNEDTLLELAKDSRSQTYAKSSESNDSSDDNSI